MKKLKLVLVAVLCFMTLAYPGKALGNLITLNVTIVDAHNNELGSGQYIIGDLDTMYDLHEDIKDQFDLKNIDKCTCIYNDRAVLPALSFRFLGIGNGATIKIAY